MSTETNLKVKNAPSLWTFFIFNSLVFLGLFFATHVDAIFNDFDKMVSLRASGIAFAPLILFIVNGFLSSNQKAILVFWKFHNPLPGSRAFSVLGKADSRVDMDQLNLKHGPLPLTAADQNNLWYKLYRQNAADTAVNSSHGAFLLARDLVSMSFLFVVFAGLPMLFFGKSPLNYLYLFVLLLEYLVILIGARNRGNRFVTNVLAVESVK